MLSWKRDVIIHARNLHKKFGGVHALAGVSLEVGKGEIFGIIGPNGAGKTVLLNVLSGIYPPDSGEVYINFRRTDGLPSHKLSRMGVARTFQITRVFPNMTVKENMLTVVYSLFPNMPRDERLKLVAEALKMTNLSEVEELKAKALSGGQKKLLEFARLIASKADVMLLDEPFAGVNPIIIARMTSILKELAEKGKTILVVSHELGVISRLCNRVAVFDRGKKIAEGELRELALLQEVKRAYLGA